MIIYNSDFKFDSHNERCVLLADYLITNKTTVRNTASNYGISKSTVHKDITEKLKRVNPALYKEVKEILDINKAERHIRGGEATKMKYLNKSGVKC
jgi:putative DeoR family transcriptional regulator (stage III sporulation protein D)